MALLQAVFLRLQQLILLAALQPHLLQLLLPVTLLPLHLVILQLEAQQTAVERARSVELEQIPVHPLAGNRFRLE